MVAMRKQKWRGKTEEWAGSGVAAQHGTALWCGVRRNAVCGPSYGKRRKRVSKK